MPVCPRCGGSFALPVQKAFEACKAATAPAASPTEVWEERILIAACSVIVLAAWLLLPAMFWTLDKGLAVLSLLGPPVVAYIRVITHPMCGGSTADERWVDKEAREAYTAARAARRAELLARLDKIYCCQADGTMWDSETGEIHRASDLPLTDEG